MIRHYKHYGAVLHRASLEPVTAMRNTDTETLIGRASTLTGVSVARINGHGRTRQELFPRLAVYLVMRDAMGMSMSMIGRKIGDRDHSTIWRGCQRAEAMRGTNPAFRALCDRLEAVL